MLMQLTMFPTDKRGASVSEAVSKVIDIVDKSGLPYRLGPMSTTIEGDFDSLMALVDKARRMLRRNHDRIYISMTIDDRKKATKRLTGKIESIETRLKRKVRT
jgi:uncharacterized protein (TIGR00106 family)